MLSSPDRTTNNVDLGKAIFGRRHALYIGVPIFYALRQEIYFLKWDPAPYFLSIDERNNSWNVRARKPHVTAISHGAIRLFDQPNGDGILERQVPASA